MPPKAKRSKSPVSPFLFVNEDASTVTRTSKDAELDRTKQSHVQRQNFARRRRLQDSDSVAQVSGPDSVSTNLMVAGPSSFVTPENLSHGAGYFDMLQEIDLGDPLFQSTSPRSVSQRPLETRLSTLFSDPSANAPALPPILSQTSNAFRSLYGYSPGQNFNPPPSGNSIGHSAEDSDALASSPIHPCGVNSKATNAHGALEQWAPPLIEHYNTVILPENFWKDMQKVPLGRFRYAPFIHAEMQACMAEPAHMYALLASAAAQMIAREGRLLLPDISEDDIDRVPAFFKRNAIRALRANFASRQLDHHTALDIHQLYACEIYSGDYEAAEPHFQAFISLIEALGGLNTLDDYQLEKLYMLDCTAAMKRLSAPRLVLALDANPLPQQILSDIGLNNLHRFPSGSMLEGLSETSAHCPVLVGVFTDLAAVIRVSIYLANTNHYIHEYYKWLSWQTLTILHRLLSMPLQYDMDDKTDSIRIATALWTASLRSPAAGRRAAVPSVNTLRSKLENTDLGLLWQPHTVCLLWVSVIGGICCPDGVDLDWFVRLARVAATEVGVGSTRELEVLLMAILYDPHSQRELVVGFADLVWPGNDP